MMKSIWRGLSLAAVLSVGAVMAPAFADELEVTMYKNPNCGCCGQWADHMREAGFSVREVPTEQMNVVRAEAGVPREMGSCHTAMVGDYVIEGHVPAADVHRLLEERPLVDGISVPGMPLGSPGMESPHGSESYAVVTFGGIEGSRVFARH